MIEQEASSPRIDAVEYEGVRWLTVERPGPVELAWLGQQFGFDPLHLDDLVSKTERPKLDTYGDYLFAVLHFPVLVGRPRRLIAAELHLFIGRDYVVSVHDGDLRPLVRLFEDLRDDGERRARDMASPGRLAYAIVLALIDATRPWTDRISAAIDEIQEQVFGVRDHEMVRQVASLRRELIQLRRMVRPSAAIVERLARDPLSAGPELARYWDDAHDQIDYQVDYLEDVWASLEALSHSFDQLSSFRINTLMRVLTVISTIMLPLAVLSGIYGMNIRGLPFAESDWAFEITLAVMLGVGVSMLVFFRRQRWI